MATEAKAQRNLLEKIQNSPDMEPPRVWKQKMHKLFHCLDTSGNGLLDFEDCEGLAMRFQKYGKLTDEDMARFKKILIDWWNKNYKDVGQLSFEDFYKTRYALLISPGSEEEKQTHYKASLKEMFHIIDTDGDGIISFSEWRVYFLAMGIEDEDIAGKAFKLVDLNGDGEMSLEEFIEGGFDFMYNQDESIYMNFLGPLPNI